MIIKKNELTIDETLPIEEIEKRLTAMLDLPEDCVTDEWVEYYGEFQGRHIFKHRRECCGIIGFFFGDGSDATPAMRAAEIREKFPQFTEADAIEVIRTVLGMFGLNELM